MKYKIAILYICTGRYEVFWDEFYKSSEQLFFKEHNKHYFVFTDSKNIVTSEEVTVIFQENEGFPNDTLHRFDMFLKIEDDVISYDYVFFLNSNMIFIENVSDEILPYKNYKGLIGVIHPLGERYYNRPAMFTYERNKKSTAYIPRIKGHHYNYFMGGFNGGSTIEFYKMVKELSGNIHEDERNGIVAIYHDESHLNKYFFKNKVHSLPISYGYPEGRDLPFKPIVMIRDKTKYDVFFDKESEFSWFRLKINRLLQYYKALIW